MLLEEMYYNVDMDEIPKYTKISGVSFYDRQQIIQTLNVGYELQLRRDYFNEYDKYAIGLYYDNKLVGWIPKRISEFLAPEIDNGLMWKVYITDITGKDKDIQGVNIRLEFVDK